MSLDDLPALARQQAGLFTREQAYGEGWSPRQVRRRLVSGRWVIVAGQAVGLAGLEVGAWQLAFAVHLTWPGAVVSHEVAGALWGFPVRPLRLGTATVDRQRGVRSPGLLAHRETLAPQDVGMFGGLPVTTRTRTAIDLLARLPWGQARDLHAWLTTRQVLADRDLADAAQARTGRAGVPQLRRLVVASRTGALSAAEELLHEILRQASFGGWAANVPVRVAGRIIAVVDVLFELTRVAIEVDGWAAHSDREAFHHDRVRQNALVLAGYTVLRFTWADLTKRPSEVVSTIRRANKRAAG
jgi:very-short-patch-repair endonuclease